MSISENPLMNGSFNLQIHIFSYPSIQITLLEQDFHNSKLINFELFIHSNIRKISSILIFNIIFHFTTKKLWQF